MAMNGRQRVVAALNGEWPDTRPIMLHNFLMAIAEAGVTHAQYRSDPQVIADVHIRAAESYGVDGVLIDVDTAVLAGAAGVPVDFPENDPARVHEPALATIEAVDDLEPVDIAGKERVQIWLEAVRRIKQHFGDEVYVRGNCDQCPFSVASMMRTAQEWMMDIMTPEEEPRVRKLLDHCTSITSQFVTLMARTGADMTSNGDSPAGPDMISPPMYRSLALPYEKQVAQAAHEAGTHYMLHICGNTDAILDDMAEVGADSLELDYKTDIRLIHEKFKDRLAFSGNIDPANVIGRGTPDLVVEKTRELLELYADSPRLILNAGCAIPAMTPRANLEAMIRTSREFPCG